MPKAETEELKRIPSVILGNQLEGGAEGGAGGGYGEIRAAADSKDNN